MYVLRHESDADADWGCEQFAGIVATVLAGARQRPDMLPSLMGSALTYAGFLAVRDSDAVELDGALRLATNAGTALFACATADSAFDMPLGAQIAHLWPYRTKEANAESFRLAWSIATIVRDRGALDALGKVPDTLFVDADPVLAFRARALQQIGRDDAAALALIETALEGADVDRARQLPSVLVRAEIRPELEVLRALLGGDPREFNRLLVRALEEHRRWRGQDAFKNDSRHFLAFGPLAFAAMARDRGLRIDVQSEYMPLRLQQGDLDPDPLADGEPVPWEEDAQGSMRFVLCQICGSPASRRNRTCSACHADLATSPPLELEYAELAAIEHTRCRACREPMLKVVHVCPRCGAMQDDSALPVSSRTTQEVALRPFPPEYHAHVLARRFEPSRIAGLLPGEAPDETIAMERLRRAGLEIAKIDQPRRREGPEAPWELEVEARAHGDAEPTAFQIWPVPIDWLPGFDRAALGPGVVPGEHAIVVHTRFGRALLSDLHRQIRMLDAVATDAIGVVDLDSRVARSRAWLHDAATSPVPPDAAELYAIRVVRGGGDRCWLHTRGLSRCGAFEVEMLDVPSAYADRFARLLDAAARRLIEVGDTVPPEEQAFQVGELRLAWVPSAWARREVGVLGFGALEEHRVGLSGLSAALLAATDEGNFPIASLVPRLSKDPVLFASRLDATRDRESAIATLPRFRALRLAHHGQERWQFLVRRDEDEAWWQVDDVVGGEAVASRLPRGEPARFGLDQVVDWEIECPEGRITPADALAEMAQVRRAEYERQVDERHRTPIMVDRSNPAAVTMDPQPPLAPAEEVEEWNDTTEPSMTDATPSPTPPSRAVGPGGPMKDEPTLNAGSTLLPTAVMIAIAVAIASVLAAALFASLVL